MELPRVLVIGCGGTKIYKALGFITALEDKGFLNNISIYSGVSAGALTSLLLTLGYTSREISGHLMNIDLFNGNMSVNGILENNGLLTMEPIRKTITSLMISKYGKSLTFEELYLETGFKLVVGSYNLDERRMIMFNKESHPNVLCIDSVLASMCVFLFFQKVIINNQTYYDGAFGNPYPIDYFDNGTTIVLGIYMKSIPEVVEQSIPEMIRMVEHGKFSLLKDFNTLLQSLLEQKTIESIRRCSDKCYHVELLVKTDQLINLSLNISKQAELLTEGYSQGKRFVESYITESYVHPNIPELDKYNY